MVMSVDNNPNPEWTPIELKPDEVPEWATPSGWEKTKEILNRAEEKYRELDKHLDLEKTKFGKFIIISCTDINRYVIGDTEAKTDELWRTKFGDDDDAALFQIGYV